MTSQLVHPVLPFPKFTRGGFGFSLKSRSTMKPADDDEDWYIPYNGPYEAPRELPNRRKARDSWGDPVEPEDDEEDTVLNKKELYLPYNDRNNAGTHVEEDRQDRRRDRTFSITSHHTVSSSRPSTARPSTVSTATRLVLPSYINPDALGGVGESPVPPHRSSREGNRLNLAGIFSLGAQPRRPTSTTASAEHTVSGSFVRKPSLLHKSNIRTSHGHDNESQIDSPARYSSSPEQNVNPPTKDKHQRLHHRVTSQADRFSSATEDDYYNSYYSTLIHEQRSQPDHYRHRFCPSPSDDLHHSQQLVCDQSSLHRQNSSSTSSDHPYALATPRDKLEGFSTTSSIPPSNPPRLTFTAPSHNPSSVDPSNFSFARLANPRSPKLKNSNSTPDMRNSAIRRDDIVTNIIPNTNFIPQQIATPRFVFPKAKDRWLSAETWCDALLFPRPRLKVETTVPTLGGSGRIVSPPDSPLGPDPTGWPRTRESGVASRVLAHSRSLVDLNASVGSLSSYVYPLDSTSVSQGHDPQTSRAGTQSRPYRPVSFAQDDLALPTPIPCLADTLAQGQQLADERKAWQLQAQRSLGNKRTRSLSRTRSKSLTQKGRRGGHQVQTSIEYLAAQACLGNQNLTPILPAAELNTIAPDSTYTSSSRKASHSHGSSHTKTVSKSSKSHSRNHSRGDSFSKSAVKMAKSTAAICGFSASQDDITEGDARITHLEGALKTKFIHLADPAYIPIDRGPPVNTSPNGSTRLTPSPSANSDQGVGIALGTPTLGDDQDDAFYHPYHPYAQGGLSFSVSGPASNQTRIDRGTEFAGPHPSINSGIDIPHISDTLARHKLPPHLLLHPYAQGSAQGSSRDTYLEQNGLVAQYRSNDDTPRQIKMWAQLSPGVLREVLPGDIQYSPFTLEKNDTSPISTSSSNHMHINDTIGVGETLVNAVHFRRSQDSGIGTNDSDHVMAAKLVSQADWNTQVQNILPEFEPRAIREPTEYNLEPSENPEALQPPSLTNRSFSTSPEPPLILVTDRTDSSPTITSASSSPYLIPRRLGSPNDLEGFQDLFYRPNNSLQRTPSEAALPDTPCPPNILINTWDRNLRRHRTESGLTSLARQLGQEFELMAGERERSSSRYSSIPSSIRQSGGVSRRPTEGSLQFVFEEGSQSLDSELDHSAFQSPGNLPEDVGSSRASSLIERIEEEDDEDTAMVRLGVVESVSTPPSVPPQNRPNSYTGETSLTVNNEHPQHDQPELSPASGISSESRARTFSGLRPPSSEEVRSSYMTTSTGSRISNLSDFPAPPKDNHMSLGTYFNEALAQRELRSEVPSPL